MKTSKYFRVLVRTGSGAFEYSSISSQIVQEHSLDERRPVPAEVGGGRAAAGSGLPLGGLLDLSRQEVRPAENGPGREEIRPAAEQPAVAHIFCEARRILHTVYNTEINFGFLERRQLAEDLD